MVGCNLNHLENRIFRVDAWPSRHDEGHVEAEDEGEGDAGQLSVAVPAQRFKRLAIVTPSDDNFLYLFIYFLK